MKSVRLGASQIRYRTMKTGCKRRVNIAELRLSYTASHDKPAIMNVFH